MDDLEEKERVWKIDLNEDRIELTGTYGDPDADDYDAEDEWFARLYYNEVFDEDFYDNSFYQKPKSFDALCDLFVEELKKRIQPSLSHFLSQLALEEACECIKKEKSFIDCIQKVQVELKLSSAFRTMWMEYNKKSL